MKKIDSLVYYGFAILFFLGTLFKLLLENYWIYFLGFILFIFFNVWMIFTEEEMYMKTLRVLLTLFSLWIVLIYIIPNIVSIHLW